jgi:hypothetical protein
LFGETVVVFVAGTAMGEGEGLNGVLPVDGIVINEPGAVIAVELENFEEAGEIGGFKSLKGPDMGLVQQAVEL